MEKQNKTTGNFTLDKTIYFKSTYRRRCRNIVLILLGFVFLFGCRSQDEEVKLIFVGDILLSRNVKTELDLKKSSPWEDLKTFFKDADFVIGNLEGSISDDTSTLINNKQPLFSIDSNDLSLLADAGFNIITLENNHSYDFGEPVKNKTFKSLLNKIIAPIDFDHSPYFFKKGNKVISLIAINTVLDYGSTQDSIPSVELIQKLSLAKALSDYVIVSIHWGSELLEWPNKSQRDAADWLTLNGADLIIGSHPHVIQKPELVNGKPVYYSLGNHLFDQKYLPTKEGLIVEVILSNGKVKLKNYKTINKQNSFYPTINQELDFGIKSTRYQNSNFIVGGISIVPESVLSDENNQIILQGVKERTFWKTAPLNLNTIELFSEKENMIFMLQTYYSPIDKAESIRPYVYSVDDHGLNARWRGSALAWPLIDAKVLQQDSCLLCALHRGDSFLVPNPNTSEARVAVYKWNGFGFNLIKDSVLLQECKKLLNVN